MALFTSFRPTLFSKFQPKTLFFYFHLLKLNQTLNVRYNGRKLHYPLDLIRWFASRALPTNASLSTERTSCSVCATSATSLCSNRNVSPAPSGLDNVLIKNSTKSRWDDVSLIFFRFPVIQLRWSHQRPRLLETEPRLLSTGSRRKRSRLRSKRWGSLRGKGAPLWLAHSDLPSHQMGFSTRLLGVG